MKEEVKNIKPFSTRKSIQKAAGVESYSNKWHLHSADKDYIWTNRQERVRLIREGIPYASVEVISNRLDIPVKSMLDIIGLPQTTYNKRKREHSLLDSRDSELILLITELLDYGLEVFNHEEDKFNRWLRKPNLSLGGNTPKSMLDTTSGIDEVKHCLNRIEFGNFA